MIRRLSAVVVVFTLVFLAGSVVGGRDRMAVPPVTTGCHTWGAAPTATPTPDPAAPSTATTEAATTEGTPCP